MEKGIHEILLQDVERKNFLLYRKGNGNGFGFYVREVEKTGRESRHFFAAIGRSGRRCFISFTGSEKNRKAIKAPTPKRGRRFHCREKIRTISFGKAKEIVRTSIQHFCAKQDLSIKCVRE